LHINVDSFVLRADATTGSKRKWFKYLTDAKIQVNIIVMYNLPVNIQFYAHYSTEL